MDDGHLVLPPEVGSRTRRIPCPLPMAKAAFSPIHHAPPAVARLVTFRRAGGLTGMECLPIPLERFRADRSINAKVSAGRIQPRLWFLYALVVG